MTYRYVIAHKGKLERFSDPDSGALIAKVNAFMQKNNIKFDAKVVKAAIDRQTKMQKKANTRVTLSDAFQGAKALVRFTSGKAASQKEVLRRAEICKACPLMSSTSGCMACGAAARATQLVNSIQSMKKGAVSIPSEVKSKFCGVCSCSIPLMIVTKYEDFYQETDEKNSRRPDGCWLKKTSPKFTNE